ncbi:hypothetical protein ABVK25_007615 [Lepraria finkii]|uniref:Uncharacterized protein n=1 Tax=Lepraria finkii TaxID=1340010 RepID=A0ABR4B438_9LECA
MAIKTISQRQTGDGHYRLTPSTFTKRETLPHEKRRRPNGPIITLPQSRERLENERDTLAFIVNNTAIPVPNVPVPKVLDFTSEGGITSLTTEAIAGDPVFDLAS